MRKRMCCLLAVLVIAALSLADDAPRSKPGLAPKDDLPGPFRPYNVTGKWGERTVKEIGGREREVEGQFHCLVCENGLNPTVMVFARNVDLIKDAPKGLNTLLQKLNEEIQKQRRSRLGGFAVFLFDGLKDVVVDDEERFKLARELKEKVDKGAVLLLGENLPLALESEKYLKHYPLDKNAQVIVVLYNQHKVAHTFTFPKEEELADADIQKILEKAREMLPAAKK